MAAIAGSSNSSSDTAIQDQKQELIQGTQTIVVYEPVIESLPINVQKELQDLLQQYEEEEITEKGYQKKRAAVMGPYLKEYKPVAEAEEWVEPAMEKLPKNALDALRILKEELENEEITEKGYTKKRLKILEPYMLKEPSKERLPRDVQMKYKELENELQDGDITEKGYRKKRMKLIHPYLIAVHPSSYKRSSSKRFSAVKAEVKQSQALQHEQEVMENGEKLFKCKICGETFKLAQSFSGHCRLHRGEREKYHKCTFCNASYTTKSHLKFHMYKHTGDFPYNCSFCGKGFAGKSQLKYHELRHTGEAPHSCDECGSRFWKLQNLRDHKSKGCINDQDTSIEQSNQQLTNSDAMDEEEENRNSVEFAEDDLPPSMTNSFSSASSSQSVHNNNNHYISLPPPGETSMLNSNIKVKTTISAEVKKDPVVVIQAFS